MAQEAWGRWGKDDQRGALNLIGPEQVRGAVKLVKSGRVLSLAQPLGPKTPVPKHRGPLVHTMLRDGGDYAAGGQRPHGFQFAEDMVVMAVQSGTHVDALCHAWYDDKLYNGYSSNSIRSTTGAGKCGAEHLGPVVTRGIFFDIASRRDKAMEMGDIISAQELEDCAKAAGFSPQAGDVAIIRTGWQERYGHDGATLFTGEPGIGIEAAYWLAKKDIAMVGADNPGVEAIPFPKDTLFPVHQILLRDYGMPLLEGLVLKELVASGTSTFLFMMAPLPLVGATGSSVCPVAVL